MLITKAQIIQITLKEVRDGILQDNETVLALGGTKYKGKMLYYANKKWNVSKKKLLQTPSVCVFDIFDNNGNSYADTTVYEASHL